MRGRSPAVHTVGLRNSAFAHRGLRHILNLSGHSLYPFTCNYHPLTMHLPSITHPSIWFWLWLALLALIALLGSIGSVSSDTTFPVLVSHFFSVSSSFCCCFFSCIFPFLFVFPIFTVVCTHYGFSCIFSCVFMGFHASFEVVLHFLAFSCFLLVFVLGLVVFLLIF